LDFFPHPLEKMGAVSDENSENFRQNISQTVKRYGGKWSPIALADGCWDLTMETPTGENKRQKKKRCVLIKYTYFLVRMLYIETSLVV